MKKEIFIKIHFYGTLAFAFMLPIWPAFLPVLILVLGLNWIVAGNFIPLFRRKVSYKYCLLFISLFVLYLVGLFYSCNISNGWKEISTKLSLIIFPLLYFGSEKIEESGFKKIFLWFVYGCVAAALICFAIATYNFFYTKYLNAHGAKEWDFGVNWFLKDRLSFGLHPSYRAMYFVMALGCIFFLRGNFFSYKWMRYFFPFILFLAVILFASKAGIITMCLLGIYVGWKFIFHEKKVRMVLTGILIFLSVFFALYFFAPQFQLRFDAAWKAVSGNADARDSNESTAVRMEVWHAARQIISANVLIGVGTGCTENALKTEYKNEGLQSVYDEGLNTHNQFLQTIITIGLPGILSLASMLLFPLVKSLKEKKHLYTFFILLFVINIMVEAMLERQAGVFFYAFFNSLIFTQYFNSTT